MTAGCPPQAAELSNGIQQIERDQVRRGRRQHSHTLTPPGRDGSLAVRSGRNGFGLISAAYDDISYRRLPAGGFVAQAISTRRGPNRVIPMQTMLLLPPRPSH